MRLHSQRGTTLVEVMVATAVLLVAGLGMLGLHVQQLRMNGDARRITEATALAQDLVENITMWSFDDPRLATNSSAPHDDIGDSGRRFELDAPVADHTESDLGTPTSTPPWNGSPARAGFERYWNVAYVDDTDHNGVSDAARVAVIVRWRTDGGWRRIVVMTSKLNPAEVK
jgi:Tfp pilus assembly protein PilV